jgi:hypothetical protein
MAPFVGMPKSSRTSMQNANSKPTASLLPYNCRKMKRVDQNNPAQSAEPKTSLLTAGK